MVGQDGLVLLANPAARAMLGVAPEAMTGRPFFQAIEHEPLRRLFEIGQPGVAELALPDGRIAQASLVFVATEYGEPVGLAAVLRDITLLKNLEQMKNDFVNTVSHDLKSPIMAIAMTAELLMKMVPATGEQAYRDRCQRILRSANQMTELVTDLLDLGKIEAGLEGPGEPVDLVALIDDVVKAQTAPAEAKGLAIEVETPPAALVTGVRARLAQVLANLIGNAVKYAGRRTGSRRGRGGGLPRWRPGPGADHRQRDRHPRAGRAARLRQVLPGQERLHRRDLGYRPRPRHHPQHRGDPRRPDRSGKRGGLRQHVLGRAARGAARRRPPRVTRG